MFNDLIKFIQNFHNYTISCLRNIPISKDDFYIKTSNNDIEYWVNININSYSYRT